MIKPKYRQLTCSHKIRKCSTFIGGDLTNPISLMTFTGAQWRLSSKDSDCAAKLLWDRFNPKFLGIHRLHGFQKRFLLSCSSIHIFNSKWHGAWSCGIVTWENDLSGSRSWTKPMCPWPDSALCGPMEGRRAPLWSFKLSNPICGRACKPIS